MPISLPAFGSQTNAKQSPPRPELTGSTNPSTAFAATAASTAEPPRLSIAMAVCVASGCAVPAAPESPSAGERVAKLAPAGPIAGVNIGPDEALRAGGLKFGKVLRRGRCALARRIRFAG